MGFAKIRIKRGTANQWTAANPILSEGEVGVVVPNTGVGTGICDVKIGDGLTAWNNLPFAYCDANKADASALAQKADSSEVSNLTATVSNNSSAINSLKSRATNLESNVGKIKTDIYPVGAIYMSVNSTSPASLFGGTWEQIKDRFLLAAGSTYSAGSTGGEATHKLTVAEMPAHKHTINQLGWASAGTPSLSNSGQWVAYDANNSCTLKTGMYEAGGNAAHNNMPPYLTVYMWKRVS